MLARDMNLLQWLELLRKNYSACTLNQYQLNQQHKPAGDRGFVEHSLTVLQLDSSFAISVQTIVCIHRSPCWGGMRLRYSSSGLPSYFDTPN